MQPRLTGVVLALIALLAGSACFKSSTLQASSESSSGSSASSSGSSSGPSRYVKDIRDYTAEWVLSGGDVAAFRRKVSGLAEKRGVSNWEQDEDTYRGIGRGLKKAGVRAARLGQLKSQLAGPNPKSPQWIQAGYDAEKAG